MATIFGKEACPHTQRAIDHHRTRGLAFEHVNVKHRAPTSIGCCRPTAAIGGCRRSWLTMESDDGFGGS